VGLQAIGCRHLVLGCHALSQRVPKAAEGCGCAIGCKHLVLGCHALGARSRHVCLDTDPGKQVGRTTHLGSKRLLGHCSKT
jgi:hypothetical protein